MFACVTKKPHYSEAFDTHVSSIRRCHSKHNGEDRHFLLHCSRHTAGDRSGDKYEGHLILPHLVVPTDHIYALAEASQTVLPILDQLHPVADKVTPWQHKLRHTDEEVKRRIPKDERNGDSRVGSVRKQACSGTASWSAGCMGWSIVAKQHKSSLTN